MIPDILIHYIPNFLLILLRASIIIVFLPFFNDKSIPVQFKIGLVLTITLVLTPLVEFKIQENNIPIIVIKEIIFGLAIGIGVRTIFLAIELAGDAISNAMGISIATTYNPSIGGQSATISRLYNLFIVLLFFTMDIHHDIIYVFVKSYELLPVGGAHINNITNNVIALSGKVFEIGIKIGAPVVVGMMITNFLLGFIYKASPQINIFFVSMPVNLFIGFTIMLITTPILFFFFGEHLSKIKETMLRIIILARG